MQIKTIVGIFADKFDEEVNKYLADGWKLSKRDILKTPQGALEKFYAELVKHEAMAEINFPTINFDGKELVQSVTRRYTAR